MFPSWCRTFISSIPNLHQGTHSILFQTLRQPKIVFRALKCTSSQDHFRNSLRRLGYIRVAFKIIQYNTEAIHNQNNTHKKRTWWLSILLRRAVYRISSGSSFWIERCIDIGVKPANRNSSTSRMALRATAFSISSLDCAEGTGEKGTTYTQETQRPTWNLKTTRLVFGKWSSGLQVPC